MLSLWKILNKYRKYDTPIFSLFEKEVMSPTSGKKGDFYTLETGDWVNIIALTKDNHVILVRQYRHGTEDLSLEIPGGGVDPADANPEEAARRELREETGYTSDDWVCLGKISANAAIMNNYCHCYFARDCIKTDVPKPDPFEEIAIETLSVAAFLKKVAEGDVHHSIVVAAVALWQLYQERSRSSND